MTGSFSRLVFLGVVVLAGCGDKPEEDGGSDGDPGAGGSPGGGSEGGGDDGGDTGDDGGGSDDTGATGDCAPVMAALDVPDPIIGLSPSTEDFGTLDLGCTESVEVVMENRGGLDLTLSDIELKTGSDEFTLALDTLTFPITLAPGEALCLELAYEPTDTYDDVAYLIVESDDPDTPSIMSVFDGGAVSVGEQTDSHTASGGTSFALSAAPVEATLVVRIDGVTTTTGWSYDPAATSVEFDSTYVPEPGAVVEIGYSLSGC